MRRDIRRPRLDEGFTLVEVLVVVLVIGILAAIAIPTFTGVQDAVRQAATESDLASNRTALVEYAVDNNGQIPAASGFDPTSAATDLTGYGWSQSAETTGYRYYTNPAATAWCLEMTNSTGVSFHISTNTDQGDGGCASLAPASY